MHRDIKPSNILFDETGQACLADFGIARLGDGTTLTQTGQVIGSAPYLAPEQVTGQQTGTAADVYSLGLVLIECLTGCTCYQGGHVEAAVSRLHRPPSIPDDAPRWLRDVLSAMTATNPRRRPSAAAVAEALRRQNAEPVLGTTAEYGRDALAELLEDSAPTTQHDEGQPTEIAGDPLATTPQVARSDGTALLPVGTSPGLSRSERAPPAASGPSSAR